MKLAMSSIAPRIKRIKSSEVDYGARARVPDLHDLWLNLEFRATAGGRADAEWTALIEEVRFARDSPLEGDGFELPVPRVGGTELPAAAPPESQVRT